MKRRSFLAIGSAGSLPIIAGCTDNAGRAEESGPTSDTSGIAMTETDESTTPTDERAPSDDTPVMDRSPPTRLRIRFNAAAEGEVSIELADVDTGDVAYETDYTLGTSETSEVLDLSDRFESGATYRVTISNANETIFERDIASYEGYELEVTSEESVEVDVLIEN